MKMPCECKETDEARMLKERGIPTAILRFVGGFHKKPSGPYMQYETGEVYEVNARFANREAYPYWAPCDEEEHIPEENEYLLEDEEEEPSEGLSTLGFTINAGGSPTGSGGMASEREIFNGMDKPTLRLYIAENGGKPDKRWGRKRLVQEALKL